MQIIFLRTTFNFLIIAISLAGCCTVPKQDNQVSQFRCKHPTEAKKYVYLNPISLDTYYATFGWGKGSEYVETNLKEKFGSNPEINEFADKAIKTQRDWNDLLMQLFKRLESASSNGGVICQYKLNDGIIEEIGFLVLKSGEIVKQEPLITDYLPKQPTSKKPHNE